jgi:hypothetical protein
VTDYERMQVKGKKREMSPLVLIHADEVLSLTDIRELTDLYKSFRYK